VSSRASDDALHHSIDDLRDELRAGFDDVRGELRADSADVRSEIRALRLRVDAMLLAMIGVIATMALKL
jgi:hypothetical protein